MNTPPTARIALLLDANDPHHRDVVAGISDHLRSTRAAWELFVEAPSSCAPDGIVHWQVDGIIADLDDPRLCAALRSAGVPVVGVGGPGGVGGDCADHDGACPGVPSVASDNARLVEMAYDHLVGSGLTQFAFVGQPPAAECRRAEAREAAFCRLMARDHLSVHIHRATAADARNRRDAARALADWLAALPKPVGVIGVDDARARLVLQACASAGIAVPEDVAVVGIDDDPLGRMLARVPLSSVMPGGREIGRAAAQMLHRLLGGLPLVQRRVVVAPQGINAQASSLHRPVGHPAVRRGCHYIRQFAFQGIKAEQVADHVGLARSSLDFHFRCHLGRSIHDEILRARLESAKNLLLDPGRKLADIARSCGFKTAQYLNAVFQREFACTPMQYRRGAEAASGAIATARRASTVPHGAEPMPAALPSPAPAHRLAAVV